MKALPRYVVFLIVLVMLGGCGEDVPNAEFTFVSASKHNHLDPQRMHWMHDLRLSSQVYDTLITFDFETGEVEPATAGTWELSDDRKTYTFHIREDAKWSNGDPVTAHDYLYSWRRVLLPSFSANYISFLYRVEGAEAFNQWRTEQLAEFASQHSGDAAAAQEAWEKAKQRFDETVGIDAPDKRTLKVTLKRPVPYFPQLVAFPVFSAVHPPSVEEATTIRAGSGRLDVDESYWSDPQRVVTNGPYVIADRAPKRYILLEANDQYYARDAMKNDSILERIITDTNNQLLTYQNGKADWLPDIPTQSNAVLDLLRQSRNKQRNDVHKYPLAGTYFYLFNCDPDYTLPNGDANPLADPKVRRALALAIDRKRIVERVTQINQPVARTMVPPTAVDAYDAPVEAGVTFDPERAKELLAEAGYPNGKGLDGLTIHYNTDQGHGKIAQAVQRMWEDHLGVHVGPEPTDGNTYNALLDDQQFSIARMSWLGDYPDPLTWLNILSAASENNHTSWSNEQFEALLEKAETQTGSERMATLAEAERVLMKEQPITTFYHYVSIDLFDPDRVNGLKPNPWSEWDMDQIEVVEPDNAQNQ
jgi:oligopeptide transport system substrate-binding protein